MRIRTLSVTEVNRYIGRMVEGDPILSALSIRGEISNFKVYASGHAYFNLKDEGGKLPCVMFKGSFENILFNPEEGTQVIARGHMSVYERDGRYQLMVHHLQQEGEGTLYLAFLQMKNELQAKGYFDSDRKQPIPQVHRVGVVTSPDGAAVHDFITVLKRRNPLIEVVVYPTRVQGEGASEEIAKGVAYFDQKKTVDAIVVTRGGGSIEELWAFNEQVLADAIFKCTLPVISAVGHETDTTIVDFVSDFRAPTPSAAAEVISKHLDAYKESMASIKNRAAQGLENQLRIAKSNLNAHNPVNLGRRMLSKVEQQRLNVDHLYNRQAAAIFYRLENARQTLKHLERTLTLHHPKGILDRGFALVKDDKGSVVSSIKGLKTTKSYTLLLKDGEKLIQVKKGAAT